MLVASASFFICNFCRAMLCIRYNYDTMIQHSLLAQATNAHERNQTMGAANVCLSVDLSVCLAVCHVRVFCQKIIKIGLHLPKLLQK